LATTHLDRLFAEVDRQLAEARATADGVATRAGLLISGSAVAAALLGARLPSLKGGLVIAALIVLGVATLIGGAVLVPGLKPGPQPTALCTWLSEDSERTLKELYGAKILALEGNLRRLLVMRVLFYSQGVAVGVAIGLAIAAAAGK
jgi:hypothetical protein